MDSFNCSAPLNWTSNPLPKSQFIPPGVAYTICLSINPFTLRTLNDGKMITSKIVLFNHM